MSNLAAAATRVRKIMHDEDGFAAVCKELGVDVDELETVIADTVPRLNGDGTLDGAMMNGLLIGVAATQSTGGTVDWSLLARSGIHPLRSRILQYLSEHGPASPSEMAVEFDEELSNISYHTKQLFDPDNRKRQPSFLELVDTEQVRGALKHIYKLRAKPKFLKEGEKP